GADRLRADRGGERGEAVGEQITDRGRIRPRDGRDQTRGQRGRGPRRDQPEQGLGKAAATLLGLDQLAGGGGALLVRLRLVAGGRQQGRGDLAGVFLQPLASPPRGEVHERAAGGGRELREHGDQAFFLLVGELRRLVPRPA